MGVTGIMQREGIGLDYTEKSITDFHRFIHRFALIGLFEKTNP